MITLKRLNAPAIKRLRDVDLWLPRRGATLIEGSNESGKSTLFEAVYFALYGRPLVGEEPGKATLSALIPHDSPQAQVTLTLLTGETELEVTRTLTRARNGAVTSEAALVVRQPGRPDERINAVSAVNDRILTELRGLDGDTLRNSCFMEQKGLERLESLRRDEREEAISRLLGLERLVGIERSLAPTAEERRQIERLRAQEQVARQRRLAREATEHEGDIAQRLHTAELRGWLEQRDTLQAEQDTLAADDQRLAAEHEAHQAALAQIDTLRASERRLAEAERWRWEARQASREAEQFTAQLAQLDTIEEAQAPEAHRKLADIRRLELGMREVANERDALAEARDHLRRLQAAEERERQARAQLDAAEASRAETAALLNRAHARETLTEWILARERADVREGRTQQLVALNGERGKYEHEMASARTQARQWLALTGAAVVMAVIAAALALALRLSLLWGIFIMAAIAAVGLGVRWRQEVTASRTAAWRLAQADQGVATVRAEVNLAQRLVSDDIGRLEAGLRSAGVPIPQSVEDGERILHGLPGAGDLGELQLRTQEAEAQSARAQFETERAAVEANGARTSLRLLGFTDNVEQIRGRLTAVETRGAALVAEARSLGLPEDGAGLAAMRGGMEVTVTTLLTSAGGRDETRTRMLESGDHLERALRAWADELRRVADDLASLGLAGEFTSPESLSLPELETWRERLSDETQQALTQFDEVAEDARHAGLIAERERLAAKIDVVRATAGRLRELIQERLSLLGLSAQADEPLATLTEAWPLLGEVSAREADELRAARENARMQTYHSEQTAVLREREIALGSAPLDEQELHARLEAAERDLRRRELAAELASEARARIIRRALPETEVYMRAILPELTAGRYHDIALLRDDTTGGETDLAIRMWDEQAGRYVRKNLFSGGTRDQASLALRLAFALATLPKELGATPGFIFLDEPLSAFDTERSLALARVLTTGAIAQAFAQVFLISHSQVIEPSSFDYTLRMEDGRVAESSLPSGALAETLWEAEERVGKGKRFSASA